MRTPQISIVMPVYNAQEHLNQSIDSILSQTYSDFEIVIIDDGSTNNSRGIISSYNDSRIHLIVNKHNFIESLNIGMTRARGKYMARMDSDDVMLPNRLELQNEFMEKKSKRRYLWFLDAIFRRERV